MSNTVDRHREVEEALQTNSRDYSGEHENDELARALLIGTEELQRIHGAFKAEYRDEAGERHVCQDAFFVKGTHSLYALYRLVKHRRYDAAHREVRYLLETFFLLRGLNNDKEEAADIYREYREELRELGDVGGEERALNEFHATERLFGVWRQEYDNCEEVWPDVKRIYNYFSNRSTHPVRMIGAGLDGRWDEESEEQLLTLGLYMQYGLTRELLRTYLDTDAEEFLRRGSQPIVNRCDEVLGEDVPAFLLDGY